MNEYPLNTAQLLRALYPDAPQDAWSVSCAGQDVSIDRWALDDPIPTPDELAAWASSAEGAATVLRLHQDHLHESRRALRTNAELGGFTHDGQRFDSDRDSILRITNASQAAMQSLMVGLPFATVWTCFDGYQYPVPDAGTMLQIHGALVAHGQACHTYSQALAVQIEAAETLEALQAIDITTGWPG